MFGDIKTECAAMRKLEGFFVYACPFCLQVVRYAHDRICLANVGDLERGCLLPFADS